MQIQYSKKKEELRSDPLVDALMRAKEWSQRHGRNVLVGAVVVLVVVAGGIFYWQMRRAAEAKADAAFGQALTALMDGKVDDAIVQLGEVANEFKGTPHAVYCAYALGATLVGQGRYDEAIGWFEVAARGSRRCHMIPAAALEGLGVAYEAKGELEKARQYYARALADKRLTYRRPHLRWRLALLNVTMNNPREAEALCREIVQDTVAVAYHQKAKNLLAELTASGNKG